MGVSRPLNVPSPSWPLLFAPQASTVWSDMMANVELPAPPAIPETPKISFTTEHGAVAPAAQTWTGVFLLVFVPSPSWPLLLNPQASAVVVLPTVTRANAAPPAIPDTPCRTLPFAIKQGMVAPTAQTLTGVRPLVIVPSPS